MYLQHVMPHLKRLCLFIVLILSWNAAQGRIVVEAGYEGPYQSKPGCYKIVVMVFDMTTMPDGTNLSRNIGMGYFIQGQCGGADYPDTKSCRKLLKSGIAIFNHPMNRDTCITELIAKNKAVERACLAASTFATHQLKYRSASAPTAIQATYDTEFKVLHLKLQFPHGSGNYTVTLTDAGGKQVHAQSWGYSGSSSQYSVDVDDLPKGIYRVGLSDNGTLHEEISIFLN